MHVYHIGFEIERVAVGKVYDSLPLYCTLMHWFRTELEPNEVGALLRSIALRFGSVALHGAGPDMFGADRSVPVQVIEKTRQIEVLHLALFATLNKHRVVYDDLQYVGLGYNPHVSDKETKLKTGSVHVAKVICLAQSLRPDTYGKKLVHERVPLE